MTGVIEFGTSGLSFSRNVQRPPRPVYKLQTEEDAKLSRILSKQRFHRQQLLSQPLAAPPGPAASAAAVPPSRPLTAPAANPSHSGACESQEGETSDASLLHTAPSSAWTGLRDASHSSAGTSASERGAAERSAPQHCQDLTLQDVSVEDECGVDAETGSQTSLLESTSVYLPLAPGDGPRPMTAPALSSPQPPSPLSPSPLQPPRPATSLPQESRDTNKYEAYDRRPVKALNQDILRGVLKPKFDFSPPQTSRADPAKHCHKAPVPTAESVECGTSVENSVAEDADTSPAMEQQHQQPHSRPPDPPAQSPRAPPSHELSLIKDRAGAKRAQASQKITAEKSSTATHVDVAGHKRSTSAIQASSRGSSHATVRRTGSESKRAKGRVNQARLQAASQAAANQGGDTLGSSLGTTHDSGFLSRPCSDAVVEATLDEHRAAALIQALWRGFWTRNFHPPAVSVRKEIRARRAEDHITLLRSELARQKELYKEERQLRHLQMEAIRCLWGEVQVLQDWKNEVLSRESQKSSPDCGSKQLRFALSDCPVHLDSLASTADTSRQRDLERTCLSLKSQVSQLQEALESVSSAVFQTSSLPVSLTDSICSHTGTLLVSAFDEDEDCSLVATPEGSPKSARWSSVPHSLSPYPSEEEESYFSSAPHAGAPTPPRSLTMLHRGDNSIVLRWQPSRLFDEQGNEMSRGIIGYRVYVNDCCKALIPGGRTSALASGLDSSLTYKFYVKALSGLGESNESNVLMAKLAVGETRRLPLSSDSDVSYDSDRDCDTAEAHDKLRLRKREKRKPRVHSPRSEKQSSKQSSSSSRQQAEGQRKLLDRKSTASPSPDNNRSVAAILTQPKLHKHRRTRSKDYADSGGSAPPDAPSRPRGDTSHFRLPGGEGERHRLATAPPPGSHGDGSYYPPSSPKSPKSIMKSHAAPQQRPATALEANSNQNCNQGESGGSGGGAREGEGGLLRGGQTFTIEEAGSYLQSLSRQLPATPETPPHPLHHPPSTPPRAASPSPAGRPPSPYRTHRRKRSSESSEVGSEAGGRDPRAEVTEAAASIAASTAKILGQAYDSQGFDSREDGEANESGKVKTHRRKRSKDLNRESPDRREGEGGEGGGGGAGGGRSLPVLDGRTRHSSGSRPASPMLGDSPGAPDRDASSAPSSSTVTTASTTSSTATTTATTAAPERRRLPMAELMEQRLLQNQLSSQAASSSSSSSQRRGDAASLDVAPPSRSHSDLAANSLSPPSSEAGEMAGSKQRPHVVGSEGDLVGASSGGPGGSEKTEGSGNFAAKLLQKLQSFSKTQEDSLREKKLRSKRSTAESPVGGRDSKPPSDDEGRRRRVRHRSESDSEVAAGDATLPPRAPPASDSSSGSHSDDNRSGQRHVSSHRRTPSDHLGAGGGVVAGDPRPTHSPIIMEGGLLRKSASGVRRHASFHGILPSKTRDAKPNPAGTEEAAARPDDSNTPAKGSSPS